MFDRTRYTQTELGPYLIEWRCPVRFWHMRWSLRPHEILDWCLQLGPVFITRFR